MAENITYCPSCGTPNSKEVLFCVACGKKFPQELPQPVPMYERFSAPQSSPLIPQPARSDFITLSCPNCGGRLQVTADVERFACQYCGHEHIVRREGGSVALEPVVQMMGQISSNINMVGAGVHCLSGSAERQASESAIVRLKQEIADLEKKMLTQGKLTRDLWLGGLPIYAMLLIGFIVKQSVRSFDSEVESILKYGIPVMFVLAILMLLVSISSSVDDHKKNLKMQAEIRRKQEELKYHYQVVTQPPQ